MSLGGVGGPRVQQNTTAQTTSAPQAPAPTTPQPTTSTPAAAPAQASAPAASTATPQSSSAAQASRSHDVGASMLQTKVMNAQAERELGPVSPSQKFNLTDQSSR